MKHFMTREEFLETCGDRCPNKDCPGRDGPSIYFGSFSADGGYVTQECVCHDCFARWTIVWDLKSYILDHEGDKDEA